MAVACAMGVIFLFFLALYFLWNRKKEKIEDLGPSLEELDDVTGKKWEDQFLVPDESKMGMLS